MPSNITNQLKYLLNRQLNSHFILLKEKLSISDIDEALCKFDFCMKNTRGKYYGENLNIDSFYHSDKHAVFLYYLSRTLFNNQKITMATYVYYLNKIMHSIDLFYEVEMPDIFTLVHPVGSVLGRGKYKNYFCAYQNCTVGSDTDNNLSHYPTFGEMILMFAGSKIIGKCNIGSNCIFGANSFIINTDIPDNSVVVGIYPNHKILDNKINIYKYIFK